MRAHRLLHEPPSGRGLFPRARVDRHPAPRRGRRGEPGSGTSCCGRSPRSTARAGQNPSLLTEDHPLRGREGLAWAAGQGRGRAARHLLREALPGDEGDRPSPGAPARARRPHLLHPRPQQARGAGPAGLRPARAVPAPRGCHRRVHARARPGSPDGPFNVVPRDSLSLLTALHLADKVTVPVPHPAAYAGADFLWAAGLGAAPGGFVDYVRYPCIAEGERARRELGFEARHGSRDALVAFLRYRYPGAGAGAAGGAGMSAKVVRLEREPAPEEGRGRVPAGRRCRPRARAPALGRRGGADGGGGAARGGAGPCARGRGTGRLAAA